MGLYAAIQTVASIFILFGEKRMAWLLVIMTLIHTFVMHNPSYKNTTELDKQRAYRFIYTDLCLIATLIIMMGTKDVVAAPKLKTK